jgi:hypothetical protein
MDGTPLYIIGSGLGESYFAASLVSLGNVNTHALARAPEMLRKHAVGYKDIAWSMGTGGVWYYFAVGPEDGTNTRYVTRADWPAQLAADMVSGCLTCPYSDGYHVGYAIAAHKWANSPVADQMLFRHTNRTTVPQALAAMAAWGVGSGAPVEQFWPAIGEWTNP